MVVDVFGGLFHGRVNEFTNRGEGGGVIRSDDGDGCFPVEGVH